MRYYKLLILQESTVAFNTFAITLARNYAILMFDISSTVYILTYKDLIVLHRGRLSSFTTSIRYCWSLIFKWRCSILRFLEIRFEIRLYGNCRMVWNAGGGGLQNAALHSSDTESKLQLNQIRVSRFISALKLKTPVTNRFGLSQMGRAILVHLPMSSDKLARSMISDRWINIYMYIDSIDMALLMLNLKL